MTRVWLSRWEWECCGTPFAVGDAVDFGIVRRGADEWLTAALGAELAAGVDAVESHHEEEFDDRVHGRVVAVHRVALEHIERRQLRRPGHGAPPTAPAPADGEPWPEVQALSGAVFAVRRPERFVTVSEPVPGGAVLHPASGVGRSDDADAPDDADARAESAGDPPPVRRVWSSPGWLVDVTES